MKDYSYGIIPVFVKDGHKRILIIKHIQGHRGFPKGHMEEGESELECAVRELKEETSINKIRIIEGISFSNDYNFRANGNIIEKTVKYFIAFIENNIIKIQNNEVVDYKFLDVKDILTHNFPNGMKKILQEIKDFMEINI